MRLTPLDACMGAEIGGTDLGTSMTDAAFDEIREALHTHHVLVFRAQHLDASAFLAFARRFAVPEPHVLDQFHHPDHPEILILSNVRKDGEPTGLADGGTYWHSDYSYLEVPARATMLYSIQVPKVGGDTLFADQERAYADLPETVRARIDGLIGLHLYGNRDDLDERSRLVAYPLSDEQKAKRNIAVIRHPIVRRHPFTGRKALYAVSGTSLGIDGLPEGEALALLRELAEFSTRPEYQLRVKYGVGDVVVWDNASVLHSATLTHPDDPRTLWRITTKEVGRP